MSRDAAFALKGKEYPPFAVTAERGRIKDFARAVGDLSPFYLDDAVGRASEWGDIVAPPTFAVTFRDEVADIHAVLRDLGAQIGQVVHGEQEFELFGPILPGRTYLCRTRVANVYQRSGKSGELTFVVREITVTDGANDIVVRMRHTAVVRL